MREGSPEGAQFDYPQFLNPRRVRIEGKAVRLIAGSPGRVVLREFLGTDGGDSDSMIGLAAGGEGVSGYFRHLQKYRLLGCWLLRLKRIVKCHLLKP